MFFLSVPIFIMCYLIYNDINLLLILILYMLIWVFIKIQEQRSGIALDNVDEPVD